MPLMKSWVIFAMLAAVFAGLTSVIAKLGLAGISAELGLTVRTCFVFGFVAIFAAFAVPLAQWSQLTGVHYFWLGLSGVATAVSWVFYYKALSEGPVSTIALIDKGSVLVAILLAAVILREPLTLKTGLGGSLILTGLWVIVRK